jgi:hypothetical protein
MARLTADERASLEALSKRAQEEDAEDSALEVWVRNDKGHEVKLTGSRARKFMSQFGIDDDEPAADADADADGADQDAQPGGAGDSFWGRRR